jgi:hypothetical protein
MRATHYRGASVGVAEKGNTPAVDDPSAIAACAALWNAAGPEQQIQEKSTGLRKKFTLAAL